MSDRTTGDGRGTRAETRDSRASTGQWHDATRDIVRKEPPRCQSNFYANAQCTARTSIRSELGPRELASMAHGLARAGLSYQERAEAGGDSSCVVCLDLGRTCVLLPCAHLCACVECAAACPGVPCPMCRVVCQSFLKVHM